MKTDIKVADPLSGTGNAVDVATNIVLNEKIQNSNLYHFLHTHQRKMEQEY